MKQFALTVGTGLTIVVLGYILIRMYESYERKKIVTDAAASGTL